MSTIASLNTAAPSAPATAGADSHPPLGNDDVRIRVADGLRGALGLYQVDFKGETRYMTRQELDEAGFTGGAGQAEAASAPRAFDAPIDGGGGGGGDKAKGGDAKHGHAANGDGDAGSKKAAGDPGKVAGPPKPDAEVKWAEDFRKHADDKLKKAGIPDDQRKRITDHLATLGGAALAKEAHLLDHVLKSPNADRALGTYDKTLSMSKESPRAAERLTPAMREELVRGVADRRTCTSKGLEGVLGQRTAEEAARALINMPKAEYDRLQQAMDHAGENAKGKPAKGADAHTERALMLKAVGARGDRLKETALDVDAQKRNICRDTPAGRAMGEVIAFAGEVRGMNRETLISKTTSLAINRVDRGPDVDKLPDGNTRRHVGHYQRYDGSCAPTTAQNMQAERDPIFALKLEKEAGNRGIDSDLARQQKEVLEKPHFYDNAGHNVPATAAQMAQWRKDGTLPPGATSVDAGGIAYSRLGDQAEKRLDAKLTTGWSFKHIPPAEYTAARKYMHNEKTTPAEDALAQKAFDRLRNIDGGHPTADELQAMRSNYTRNADGTSTKKAQNTGMRPTGALEDITPPAVGKKWTSTSTNGGARGMSNADITALDQRLKAGTDVPIRICNADNSGGHFMMISDVRGEGANKKYLVSDPWTGKTAWVKQSELQNFNSNWPQTHFSKDLAKGVSHTYAEQ